MRAKPLSYVMQHILVVISAPNMDEAQHLAEALVEQRLVAGVNLVAGVQSIYRWNGAVCRHGEVLLLAQTIQDRFAAIQQAVRMMHSYDTPYVAALPFVCIESTFGRWVVEQTALDTACEMLSEPDDTMERV